MSEVVRSPYVEKAEAYNLPSDHYLNIPTPDNNADVRHPDLVYVAGGWNGYAYWLAYTPYPGPSRENPCVLASQDGATWVVPPGAPRLELVSNAEIVAAGYTYGSDTDMLISADGKLTLFYRTAYENANTALNKEAIWMMQSSNGRTWTTPVIVVTSQTPGRTVLLSPAVVLEANGTYSMWTVNRDATPGTMEKRTSSDLINWSAPITCTIPLLQLNKSNTTPWHPDVQRVGNTYHCMMMSATQVLWYWVSNDGVTWTQVGDVAIPQAYDTVYNQSYRTSIAAKGGERFDVMLGAYRASDGGGRFILLRNVTLPLPSALYLPIAGGRIYGNIQTEGTFYIGSSGIEATGTFGAFAFGNGKANANYALSLGKSIVTGVQGTGAGIDSTVTALEGSAYGNKASVTASYGAAFGTWASVTGSKGSAFGDHSTAAADSVALGTGATANNVGSVAIGKDSATTQAAQVMIGPRDLEITLATKGVVLKSPNGTRYRLTVSDAGAVVVTGA